MNIVKLRKFLMDWVLPPRGIRAVCFVMSRCIPTASTLSNHKRASDRLFILANGPSLKKDLERYGEEMASHDKLCVNFMGSSELYEKLKPNICVFIDEAFFAPKEKLSADLNARVEELVRALVSKTSWHLEVVVPCGERNSRLVSQLSGNTNISVLFFESRIPMPMDSEDWSGWLRNLHAAPGQNVLVTATYLGIFWRYPEVYLLGADMSLHAQVKIEQETNLLYVDDEHYYGKERRYVYNDVAQTIHRRLSESMREYQIVFRWFDLLRKLADYAGVRVINASSYSWIDAFERPKTTGVPNEATA